MKIPESINICGITYRVIWRSDKDMHNNIGETRYNESEIWLNEKYQKYDERMAQVFLHECTHAVSEELNLNLTEDQVNNLAVGLNPIIHRII
jgi:hypothetical protein